MCNRYFTKLMMREKFMLDTLLMKCFWFKSWRFDKIKMKREKYTEKEWNWTLKIIGVLHTWNY